MNPEELPPDSNRGPQSFRVTDFSLRDFPRLGFAFVVLTALSLLAGWLPVTFLPERFSLVPLALLLGFCLGLLFRRRSSAAQPGNSAVRQEPDPGV